MSISISERYRFNKGKSSIVLAYSRPNQAWITFREDSGEQIGLEIHGSYEEAYSRYVARVDFLKQVIAA